MNQTENLKLNKYDPITDAKQPFSISDGLNANWDVIDENLVKKQNGLGENVHIYTFMHCIQSIINNINFFSQ